MSHVKLSERARNDLQRLYKFLAQFDFAVSDNGNAAIVAALEELTVKPFNGSPVEERPNVRKVVVDFGPSGYLFFHKRYEKQAMNLVTAILHQKEVYETKTIGLASESIEEKS